MRLAEAEIGSDLGSLPTATKRRVLVEFLIENQLFADAAEGQKLGSGAGYNERMQYWRRRALRDPYFDKTVKDAISDADASKFYDSQVGGAKSEEEVRARHILVESKEKAREMFEKSPTAPISRELAKQNSQGPRLQGPGRRSRLLRARPDGAAVRGGRLQAEEGRGEPSRSRPSSAGTSSRSTTGAPARRRAFEAVKDRDRGGHDPPEGPAGRRRLAGQGADRVHRSRHQDAGWSERAGRRQAVAPPATRSRPRAAGRISWPRPTAKISPFAPARLPGHARRAGRAAGGLRGRHPLPEPHRPDARRARPRHRGGRRADPAPRPARPQCCGAATSLQRAARRGRWWSTPATPTPSPARRAARRRA